jgi:hypothetical protein
MPAELNFTKFPILVCIATFMNGLEAMCRSIFMIERQLNWVMAQQSSDVDQHHLPRGRLNDFNTFELFLLLLLLSLLLLLGNLERFPGHCNPGVGDVD